MPNPPVLLTFPDLVDTSVKVQHRNNLAERHELFKMRDVGVVTMNCPHCLSIICVPFSVIQIFDGLGLEPLSCHGCDGKVRVEYGRLS